MRRDHPSSSVPCLDLSAADRGEGRTSELSRRSTRDLLFTKGGRPGAWLLLLLATFVLVAYGTLL